MTKNNKKKAVPLVVGAAGLALGVGAAAAAAITYKKNKKFKKSVDSFVDDAKEQSLNYAEQIKDRLQSLPQQKKISSAVKSKNLKKTVLKKKLSNDKKN